MDVQESVGRVDLQLRTRPKREVVAFGKLMAALAMMKAKDPLIGFQVEVFEDRTAHIPLTVLVKAVQKALDTMQWRPVIEELLGFCEEARLEMREALQFQSCAECSEQGWIVVEGQAKRCACWQAHQAKVAQLQVGSECLALPAVRRETE